MNGLWKAKPPISRTPVAIHGILCSTVSAHIPSKGSDEDSLVISNSSKGCLLLEDGRMWFCGGDKKAICLLGFMLYK